MMYGWGFGWLLMAVFWALFAAGLVWLVRSLTRRGDRR